MAGTGLWLCTSCSCDCVHMFAPFSPLCSCLLSHTEDACIVCVRACISDALTVAGANSTFGFASCGQGHVFQLSVPAWVHNFSPLCAPHSLFNVQYLPDTAVGTHSEHTREIFGLLPSNTQICSRRRTCARTKKHALARLNFPTRKMRKQVRITHTWSIQNGARARA